MTFRLRIELDIPTEKLEEAQLVQEYIKQSIEKGLGFKTYMALHNIGIDHRHSHHSHSYYAVDENGNWFAPAHVHTPSFGYAEAEFTEEEKEKVITTLEKSGLLPLPPIEPDFLEEEDMKL